MALTKRGKKAQEVAFFILMFGFLAGAWLLGLKLGFHN